MNRMILVFFALWSQVVWSYVPSTPPPPDRKPSSFQTTKPVILEITCPTDLLDFVVQDDRPAVVKIYSNVCRTCKRFDMRYKNLAVNWGEQNNGGIYSNRVRFAQMEYNANKEMCKLLKATKVPYILIYKRSKGELERFTCPPSKIQRLIDALHEHASPLHDDLQLNLDSSFEDDNIESTLTKGTEMMDALVSQMQREAGYDSNLSFEDFCKTHTTKRQK